MHATRENFGSRMAVIAALAGSAIGLGNIWRFPYLVGENGGAAFIIIYVAFSLVLSLPIFLAESVLGRSSGANCRVAVSSLVKGRWGHLLGLLMVFTPLWIVSYYSVVGGWSMEYLVQAVRLDFIHTAPAEMTGSFATLISKPFAPLFFHLGFLAITLGVVALGVKSGIERFSKWSIPTLFVIIVLIAVYSLTLPGSAKGVEYLLKPDFSKVTAHTFIDAMGQAFFSMSLGMGIIITYSSYVSKEENLVIAGVGSSVSDLLFAILAGFAILPAVFAAGIEPGSGPTLIFDTLPFIFSSIGQNTPAISAIVSILFFLAILIAALTSSISLVEVGVAYLTETKGFSRVGACVLLFFACGIFGGVCSLSFGPLSQVHLAGLGIFDFADSFASNILLVLGGLIVVILVGWVLPKQTLYKELTNDGSLRTNVKLYPAVRFLIRYIAPVGILALIISSLL